VATRSFSRQNCVEAQCAVSVEVVPSVPHDQMSPLLQNVVFGTQPMSTHTPDLQSWESEQLFCAV
jgi:hypothetical protein